MSHFFFRKLFPRMFKSVEWTAKKIVICIMIVFGLLEIATTIITLQQTQAIINYSSNYVESNVVELFAAEIGLRYESRDNDAYDIVDVTYNRKSYKSSFFLTVVDSLGNIVYPSSSAGKQTHIDLTKLRTNQEMHFWNDNYIAYVDSIPHSTHYLIGFFEKDYSNFTIYYLNVVLLLGNIVFFVVIILLMWFLILPRFEKVLKKKKMTEWELENAQKLIQQAIPVAFPQLENAELYAMLKPTKEVGGDLYDYFVKDNKLYFVVGDVSDKGTLAAQMVMVTGTVLHTLILEEKPILQIVTELNSLYCRNQQYEMFCTLFIGVINLDTLEMEYCNAGHEKALLIDSDGARFMQQKSNIVLGAFPDYEYKVEYVQLKRDSVFIQYTDGITEAKNRNRKLYGMDRLLAWANGIVGNYQSMSAKEITDSLLNSAEEFRGKAPQNDDIAILTIKI